MYDITLTPSFSTMPSGRHPSKGMALPTSPPGHGSSRSAVRFAPSTHVIFFSQDNSIVASSFIKAQQIATKTPCCLTLSSGDLQNEHVACHHHTATTTQDEKYTHISRYQSGENSQEEHAPMLTVTLPFERLLTDTARNMPLTCRMKSYAQIVHFQLKKYRTLLQNNPCYLKKLTDELLAKAHDMAVYPFCSYYVPLLMATIPHDNALASSILSDKAAGYLANFTRNNPASQRFFLRGLEDSALWFKQRSGTSTSLSDLDLGDAHEHEKMVCSTLNTLYLSDTLDKLPILDWYHDDTHTGCGLPGTREGPYWVKNVYANLPYFFCRDNVSTRDDFKRAKRLRHLARRFIIWLQSSSDDEEE